MIDKDGSGRISVAEMRGFLKHLGEQLGDAEIEEMMRDADMNGDGQIDYDEFIKMMVSWSKRGDVSGLANVQENLRVRFDVYKDLLKSHVLCDTLQMNN